MKNLLVGLALGAMSLPAFSMPMIEMIILDKVTSDIETYNDLLSPGHIAISTIDSPILAKYWGTASIQSAAANNQQSALPAEFISSSINLDAKSTGNNVLIAIDSTEFTNPTNGDHLFTTIFNPATLVDASMDASVFIDVNELLNVTDITTVDTLTESGIFNVGDDFTFLHIFDLDTKAVGADIGFDISTRASPIPLPSPLALLGVGLLLAGFTRNKK